jgi:hypothetical protein
MLMCARLDRLHIPFYSLIATRLTLPDSTNFVTQKTRVPTCKLGAFRKIISLLLPQNFRLPFPSPAPYLFP